MSKKFLVAIDGSEHGWKALDTAAEMAKGMGATLSILHVVPYEPLPHGLAEFAKIEGVSVDEETARFHTDRALGDALTVEAEKRARAAGLQSVDAEVAEGNTTEEIVNKATLQNYDAVILGSRGRGGLTELLLGSVSNKVMHLAPCTCVVVK